MSTSTKLAAKSMFLLQLRTSRRLAFLLATASLLNLLGCRPKESLPCVTSSKISSRPASITRNACSDFAFENYRWSQRQFNALLERTATIEAAADHSGNRGLLNEHFRQESILIFYKEFSDDVYCDLVGPNISPKKDASEIVGEFQSLRERIRNRFLADGQRVDFIGTPAVLDGSIQSSDYSQIYSSLLQIDAEVRRILNPATAAPPSAAVGPSPF